MKKKKDPKIVDQIMKRKFNMTDSELQRFKYVEEALALSGQKVEIDSLLQSMRSIPDDDDYMTNAMDAANHEFTIVAVRTMIRDMKILSELPDNLDWKLKATYLKSTHNQQSIEAINKLRKFAEQNELDFQVFLFYVTNNILSALTVYYRGDGWGDYEKRIASYFPEEDIPYLDRVNDLFAHHLEKLRKSTK